MTWVQLLIYNLNNLVLEGFVFSFLFFKFKITVPENTNIRIFSFINIPIPVNVMWWLCKGKDVKAEHQQYNAINKQYGSTYTSELQFTSSGGVLLSITCCFVYASFLFPAVLGSFYYLVRPRKDCDWCNLACWTFMPMGLESLHEEKSEANNYFFFLQIIPLLLVVQVDWTVLNSVHLHISESDKKNVIKMGSYM